MALTDAPARALPRPYLTWLSAVTVSQLGDAVLYFALGWAAAGLGGATAAVVLTLSGLPRLVLLVVGGAVADQIGARRILVAGEAALLALTLVLALALHRFGTPAWLLISSSLALGTVTAFCLPATGSMPRRLVPDDQLAPALALRQSVGQVVAMTAAPLGGLLVGSVGVPGIAWADAVTFGVSLCVLLKIQELGAPPAPPTTDGGRAARIDLADGVRVVARDRGLRAALLLVGAAAALMLPVPSLLVPLLGRASAWGVARTGIVAGAVGVGVIVASLAVARRRGPTPATGPRMAVAGLTLSATGTTVLATSALLDGSTAVAVASAGGVVFGLGNGAFVARLAPLVLGSAPRTHLARVQALVGLVQIVPVMMTNLLFGVLAEHTAPGWSIGAAAAGLATCAVWAHATFRPS